MRPPRSWRDDLIETLALVERGPVEAGAWKFGAGLRGEGVILVEGGRICWAAAAGGRPLTDVLVEERGLSRSVVQTFYRRCHSEGRPFGQSLVEAGMLDAEALRSALLQQTAEAVVILASSAHERTWVSHRSGSYAPQFTFDAVEVATHATAFATGTDARARGAGLASLLRGGGWGAAYVVGTPLLPVASVGAVPSFTQLLALGEWAHQVTAAWARHRAAARLVTWWLEDGAAMAWRDSDGPCAALCADAAAASRLLGRHARTTED